METWEEVWQKERYHLTLMDPRSHALKDSMHFKTIGALYGMSGLRCRAAKAPHSAARVPACKEYLRIDYDKKHPHTGKDGKPRLFAFNSMTNWINEIRSRQWVPVPARKPDERPKEVPEKRHDHTQNAMEYILMQPPRYFGPPSGKAGALRPDKELTTLPTRYK